MTLGAGIRPFWTTTDGVELAGRHWASDPSRCLNAAVVLAHGFTASTDDAQVVALATALAAAGYDVVSYDARGHGASGGLSTLGDAERFDVAAAHQVAETLASRVVLVGASMGAIAVLRHAAFAPQVDGVVVLSCPARWRLPRSAGGAAAVALTRTRLGRHVAARKLGVRVAPRWTAPAPPVELVGHVEGAVAIVHGERDRFIPPAAARELYAAVPGARLEVVPDLGHGFAPAAIAPLTAAIDWTLQR